MFLSNVGRHLLSMSNVGDISKDHQVFTLYEPPNRTLMFFEARSWSVPQQGLMLPVFRPSLTADHMPICKHAPLTLTRSAAR